MNRPPINEDATPWTWLTIALIIAGTIALLAGTQP